ncbi:O-antigen ligase family protein [Synechococcus moorigangaii CMS01]|nr:O-antigen ligase family protein [Synechococcus moorigangaii CMS01]
MVLFPLAPGWGVACLMIQMIMLLKQAGRSPWLHPIAWIFGALTVWLFGISLFSPYPLESLLGMANFAPFFLFFLAFAPCLNTCERLERLAWLIVLPSLAIALLGLGDLWFGWRTPPLIWQLFGWGLTGEGNPATRLASTFMYANICAAYLVMVFLLGVGLWLKQFAWRKFKESRLFLCLTVTLFFDGIALVLTNSRNAWAIAFLGLFIYALYIGWWWICGFATGLGTAIAGASFGKTPWREPLRQIVPYYFWGRLSDQMYSGRATEDLRVTQWQFALDMIRQRPITGWGIRSFTPSYEMAMNRWLGHPHNLYLMLTSEMGIPFAALFIGTVGWLYAQGVLAWCRLTDQGDRLLLFSYLMAFGGYILFNTLDVTVLDLRLNLFAWLLLSGIWGLGQQINQPRNQGQGDSHPEQSQS